MEVDGLTMDSFPHLLLDPISELALISAYVLKLVREPVVPVLESVLLFDE